MAVFQVRQAKFVCIDRVYATHLIQVVGNLMVAFELTHEVTVWQLRRRRDDFIQCSRVRPQSKRLGSREQ